MNSSGCVIKRHLHVPNHHKINDGLNEVGTALANFKDGHQINSPTNTTVVHVDEIALAIDKQSLLLLRSIVATLKLH